MPTIILPIYAKSGTEAQRRAATLAANEFGWATDKKALYLGDGTKLGGNIASGSLFIRMTSDLLNSVAPAMSLPVFPGTYQVESIYLIAGTGPGGGGVLSVTFRGSNATDGFLTASDLFVQNIGAALSKTSFASEVVANNNNNTNNPPGGLRLRTFEQFNSPSGAGFFAGGTSTQQGIVRVTGVLTFSAPSNINVGMNQANTGCGLLSGSMLRLTPLD